MLLDNLGYMEKCKNEAGIMSVSEEINRNTCTYYTGGVAGGNNADSVRVVKIKELSADWVILVEFAVG